MEKKETFAQAIAYILINNKAVLPEVMQGVQEEFGRSSATEFDDFLLEEGIVEKKDLLRALEIYYEIPSFDVTGKFFDSLLLRNFPEEFLTRNAVIPYQEENANMLTMIAANPKHDALESAVRTFTNYDVNFLVGLRQDIIDAVREFYDNAVTQVPEDIDLREEHRDEVDAYEQMLQGSEEAYKEEQDGITESDDIRR